jgi:hypothetical protein
MIPRTLTMVRRPTMLRGELPRYQVFDRRKSPPMTVSRFYVGSERGAVVFEVYEDGFREFLKRAPGLSGKRFEWMLDVDPDAPTNTISEIVVPEPMPDAELRGDEDAPLLTLAEAIEAIGTEPCYWVIPTSDPV